MTFFIDAHGGDPGQPSPEPAHLSESDTSVGPLLKARRLELGLKHKDVAKDIKIKVEFLKAIEEEEFDRLPTEQYLRLFLKTYAEYLGFDTQEIYAVYDTQEMPPPKPEKKSDYSVDRVGQTIENDLPPSADRSRLKALLGPAIGLIVVAVIIAIWLHSSGNNADKSGPESVGADTTEAVVAKPPVATPDSANAKTVGENITPPETGYLLQMRGLDSTWMVIQADDDTVFIGFMAPGDAKSWRADSAFKFSLTNYPGVEASINGRYLKPFGQWRGPVQAREVGGYNLNDYLDSTRLAEESAEL